MTFAGRDEIEDFYRGAVDRVFTMEAGTAQACAGVAQRLIDGLVAQRASLRFMAFEADGTFDSAAEMFAGFEAKAGEFRALLLEYIAAAERLKSSFEIAGAVVAAAEAESMSGVTGVEGGGGR